MHSDEDKEIFFIKDKFFPKICLHHLKFLNFFPKSLTTQEQQDADYKIPNRQSKRIP